MFVNRRGYAPDPCGCGWQAECKRDSFHLAPGRKQPALSPLDSQQRVPSRCPSCGSSAPSMKPVAAPKSSPSCWNSPAGAGDPHRPRCHPPQGTGQQTDHPPGRPGRAGRHPNARQGHHFPKLALVVILDMDAGFERRFRGPEQAAQLLLQVAGRSGREVRAGIAPDPPRTITYCSWPPAVTTRPWPAPCSKSGAAASPSAIWLCSAAKP